MVEYQVPERRAVAVRLVVILGLLILLGVLVWVIFFRQSSPTGNVGKTPSVTAPSSQSSDTSKSNGSKSSSSGKSSSNKKSSAPSELTDAGPGNVLGAVAAVAVAGAAGYHLYLRRKLSRTKSAA